jgi:hypothetical protein
MSLSEIAINQMRWQSPIQRSAIPRPTPWAFVLSFSFTGNNGPSWPLIEGCQPKPHRQNYSCTVVSLFRHLTESPSLASKRHTKCGWRCHFSARRPGCAPLSRMGICAVAMAKLESIRGPTARLSNEVFRIWFHSVYRFSLTLYARLKWARCEQWLKTE